MPPPARLRTKYICGRCGEYLAVTVDDVDGHLRALRVQLRKASGARLVNLGHDVDLLLSRRYELEPVVR